MKKVLLGALGLLAIAAGPAMAADLPAKVYTKAPAVVPIPIYNWGGFYIGANAGYGWSRRCIDVTAINGLGFLDAEGCPLLLLLIAGASASHNAISHRPCPGSGGWRA